MYHSRIVLSVGGSVWYMVRNLRCTVTTESVLANSKIHNAFLFPVHSMFRHDYPLAVKPTSTPRRLVNKDSLKTREIPYLSICSVLLCLLWLLRSRVRKFRKGLRITLYMFHFPICVPENHKLIDSVTVRAREEHYCHIHPLRHLSLSDLSETNFEIIQNQADTI